MIVVAALATMAAVAAHPGPGVAAPMPLNQAGAISTGITPPAATLYSADWSAGLNGWAGSGAWKTLDGTLLNDGTASDDFITAPWIAGGHSNYVVEAEIRLIQDSQHEFGVFARRGEGNSGYEAHLRSGGKPGIWDVVSGYGNSVAEGDPFTPGAGWHRYRLEVNGNVITFSVDGATLVTGTDNRYLAGGRVGLYSYNQQLEVRSFRVVAGISGLPGLPTAFVPTPPTGLTVIAASPTAIKISWNDGSDNETGFEINNGEISAMVGPDVTSYTWTGLSPGSYMCVHVRAVNGARSSVWEPADAPYYQCTTTPASPAN
jgi:hypothetical protein